MTNALCPNCGKPLRPGASFCGVCGNAITSAPSPEMQATAPPVVAGAVCPHCGIPVRSGVKFCTSCGEAISLLDTQPLASEPDASVPLPPAPEDKKLKGLFHKYALLIGLIAVLCCVVTISAGLLYQYDPFNWRVTPTATRSQAPPAVETELSATNTPPPSPTGTAASTPTNVDTRIPSETPPPQLVPTVTASLTPTLSVDTPPLSNFEDDFSGSLQVNWKTWGSPEAQITANGELELNSQNPGDSGVTTVQSIHLRPGTIIQFWARLSDGGPQDVIFFDWDAGKIDRKPGAGPGAIHMEIGNGWQQLETERNPLVCQRPLVDIEPHNYEIRIGEGRVITFLVDGEEVCSIPGQGLPPKGRISYSGRGWVDIVTVVGRN